MIRVKSVSKVFGESEGRVPALTEVELTIAKGECVLIGGTSGSGKTTLLNIIGCLTRPTAGDVLIEGTSVARLPEHFRCDLRRAKIGFVFQQFHLLTGFSAVENVGMPLAPLGLREAERRRRAAALLDSLGLSHRADFPVNELSGGEQQRVAIARALVNDPAIVIADEPISGLDQQNVTKLAELFTRLNREGRTFLVTSHNEHLSALLPITSSYSLERGRLV